MATPLEGYQPQSNPNVTDLHAGGGFFVPDQVAPEANLLVLPGAAELIEDDELVIESQRVPTMTHPRGQVQIGGARLRFTAEEPAILEDLKSETAILLAHGVLGSEAVYEDLRHELASRGRRVITYTPPRSAGFKGYHPDHLLHAEKLLSQAAYGVMREATYKLGYERFAIVGHSMGGLTINALLEHLGENAAEILEGLYYLDAVGMTRESLARRARRFVGMVATQAPPYAARLVRTSPRKALHVARGELCYVGRKPSRLGGELLAAHGCDNTESVINARALGIRTGAIALTRSGIFPAEAVEEQSGDLFDQFVILDGDHLAPQNDPQGIADSLDDMLTESAHPFAA